MNTYLNTSRVKKQKNRGFTLVEMMVVLAIMITITAIVLFNNAKLNSAILVSNAAYEVGLIVRESQVAGLGVKAAKTAGGVSAFTSSHGLHLDVSDPSKITLFADLIKNGQYDAGEMTQEYLMPTKRSGTILAICGKTVDSAGVCSPTNTSFTSVASADIIFTRPNPEAFFKIRTVSGSAVTDFSGALVINVGFQNDVCRSITIEKTGAVQIDTAFCAPFN